jgi:hypothetical protein
LSKQFLSIFPVSIDIAFKVKPFSSHFNKFLNNKIICHKNCNNQDKIWDKIGRYLAL